MRADLLHQLLEIRLHHRLGQIGDPNGRRVVAPQTAQRAALAVLEERRHILAGLQSTGRRLSGRTGRARRRTRLRLVQLGRIHGGALVRAVH